MQMPIASRIIFVFVSAFLTIGAHLADCSDTHIFNPHWSPHANFHTGQTLCFSILLAVFTIYFPFRKTNDRKYSVLVTASFASIYWIAQACAIFYPGTAFCDPEFLTKTGQFVFGIPVQLIIELTFLTLIGIACWLALRQNAQWRTGN